MVESSERNDLVESNETNSSKLIDSPNSSAEQSKYYINTFLVVIKVFLIERSYDFLNPFAEGVCSVCPRAVVKVHSVPKVVLTFKISNTDKIVYIFRTLLVLEIMWYIQFFPKMWLPNWPICLLNYTNFNSNFMFFEKIIRGSYVFGQNCIYHFIPNAMRVLKTCILPVLEMLKVRTTLGTL